MWELLQQGPPLLLNVVCEYVHLTVDGVLLLLLMRGDAGVERYVHWGPPDVPKYSLMPAAVVPAGAGL